MRKLTMTQIFSAIVFGLTYLDMNGATISATYVPMLPKWLGIIVMCVIGVAHVVIECIHKEQTLTASQATPGTVTKLMLFFALSFLLFSSVNAQVSYTQYEGGFKFANTSVPANTTVGGCWLAPVAMGDITPVIFNGGTLTLGNSIGVQAGYGLMVGDAFSDGTHLNIMPKFMAIPYIGDNAIQNGNVYVSNALVGIGLGVPQILPNTLVGPSYNLANNMFMLSISVFTGPLDFLGGTGVFHL